MDFFCPEGSNLEFVETGNTTGSSELYSSLVERCNAEMSKAVLGNTLTTEASETGTQALGTVHQDIEQELEEQDALSTLPEVLQQAAAKRLQYPDLSLTALCGCFDPAVSKSGLSHRMKKLEALAENLRQRQQEGQEAVQ